VIPPTSETLDCFLIVMGADRLKSTGLGVFSVDNVGEEESERVDMVFEGVGRGGITLGRFFIFADSNEAFLPSLGVLSRGVLETENPSSFLSINELRLGVAPTS
jgi:hypothetical protein